MCRGFLAILRHYRYNQTTGIILNTLRCGLGLSHCKIMDESKVVPTYYACVTNIYKTLLKVIEDGGPIEDYPANFVSDLAKYTQVTWFEGVTVVVLALFMTLFRIVLTNAILQPYARWMQMTAENQSKFPESVWKLVYYAFTWSSSVYMLSRKYNYFEEPNLIWNDWQAHVQPPWDIYAMYIVQFAFYLHSVYTTVYMDHWRKDSVVMIFHHLLTMALLGFSYAARYHKVGLLVLFLHDGADICLEFTKINVYFKNRGGKYFAFHDHVATVGFLLFAVLWYILRLYWFPLKVLYSTGYGVMEYGPKPMMPFYLVFNIMLWILQFLNLYWFLFILNFIYRVATGQMSEVDDVREESVIQQIEHTVSEQQRVKAEELVNGARSRSRKTAKAE